MKRYRLIMLGLATALPAFIAGGCGGLLQWWQSMPLLRRWLYALIGLCLAALVAYSLIT